MREKILITPRGYANSGEEFAQLFHEKGYETLINKTGSPYTREEFVNLAKDATGIIFGVEEMNEELFKECKNLKAAVKFGVGLDNIDLDAAKDHNVLVGRAVGSNTNAVAETALTLMLMTAKHILKSAITVRDGQWLKISGFELTGKTVGIIGFGNIGQRVAKLCNAFDMKVLAYDPFPIDNEIIDGLGVEMVSTDKIYRESDFITLHLPLNDDTRDMIGLEEFKMMKRTASVINTARGGIVNEKALYDALKEGLIYAAGFDVFTQEPPVMEGWIKELVHMDNFILLSHIAARTEEAEINSSRIATEKMLDLLEGVK